MPKVIWNSDQLADGAVAAALVAAFAWTTWQLGGYLPGVLAVPAGLLAGTMVIEAARRVLERDPPPLAGGSWVVGGFLIYAAVNVRTVSPVPWAGWADWAGWAMMAVVWWLVLNGVRRPTSRLLLAVGVALVVLGGVAAQIYQWLGDPGWLPMGREQADQFIGRRSGTFGIPNSQAACLVLVLPWVAVAAADRRRSGGWRVAAGLAALLMTLGLLLTISRGAWLAGAGLAMVWPLVAGRRPWRQRLQRVLVIGGVLAVLGAGLYAVLPRVQERFDALVADAGERTRPVMWRVAWNLWQDAPLVGTGAGSYAVLLERHRPEGFRDEPRWAHNDYLNTLSDYGLVGFGLSFGVVGGLLILAWPRRGRESTPGEPLGDALWFGLSWFALTLTLDFHLKIPALALLVAGVTAELWRRTQAEEHSGQPKALTKGSRYAPAGGCLLVALILAVIAPGYFRAEGDALVARFQLHGLAAQVSPEQEARTADAAAQTLRTVVERLPFHGQAWADLANAESLRVRHQPEAWGEGAARAEQAARKALELSRVVPEFWLRLGVALDMQGRWSEAGRCFSEALTLAPQSSTVWYHQAYHFSLRPGSRLLAEAALATCLRLDPGLPAAEALRQQLAGSVTAVPTAP